MVWEYDKKQVNVSDAGVYFAWKPVGPISELAVTFVM